MNDVNDCFGFDQLYVYIFNYLFIVITINFEINATIIMIYFFLILIAIIDFDFLIALFVLDFVNTFLCNFELLILYFEYLSGILPFCPFFNFIFKNIIY